ncbi:MAG: TrmH family RNA methyltransferase [Gammaproteobacteria bacterium]|nr:TrmH family RNA methyltransferase [Gammaproteobacteria bacterium]
MKHRKLNFEDHKASDFKYPVSILTDNITLKENIASLFRLCDALGVEHLYLTGKDAKSTNAKFSKVSRFTERSVSHSIEEDSLQTLANLKQQGYTVISLEITSQSKSIGDFDFSSTEKICLILGSEAKGVDDNLLSASDHCVHIPMLGMNSSMNVICAASIAIYEITRNSQPNPS